jgi:hypothetical protein
VFVKAPVETKPFYVDFESTISLRTFAKVIRRTTESDPQQGVIALTEMFPAHDQLWLPDAEDNRYTSELRLVLLDCLRSGGRTS